MKKYYNIYVYEDNAGGLHLVVFDNEATPVFYRAGYERYDGFLSADIDALMHGDSPLMWESNDIDELDIEYLEWECELIADGDTDKGVTYYYSVMGRAGVREFLGGRIMDDKTLGDYFREAREIMGLNYCQIERFTGVPHDLVKRLEENSYNPRRLTFISIARLAEFYGFSLRCIREKLEEEISEGN